MIYTLSGSKSPIPCDQVHLNVPAERWKNRFFSSFPKSDVVLLGVVDFGS